MIWPVAMLTEFSVGKEMSRGTVFDYWNGIVLGIGEFGVSAILCRGLMVVIESVDNTERWSVDSWRAIGSGGWMRHYLVPVKAYPTITIVFGLLQVTAEEIVFRGVLFACLGYGLVAVFASGCGFLIISSFQDLL